jgi:hypothetical protein
MPSIRSGLSGLNPHHHLLRLNGPKSVNHDFSFDTLQRVNDQSDSPRVQLFETLLSAHIHSWQPAAETRMRVIPNQIKLPAHHNFVSLSLFQHIHHFLLVHRVHCFHTDSGTWLGHGEDVYDCDSVFIYKFSQHKTHHFHWHSSTS